MICAFSFDAANAIGGDGAVQVNGGTFFVWSDAPAFAGGTVITCGEGVVMKKVATFTPNPEVEAALGTDEALRTYCNMFTFEVVKTEGGQWAVAAVLTPEAESNLVENASAATRQIPVGDIAAMATEGTKDVTVTGCVPGFYYTLRGLGSLEGLEGVDVYGPVLCEPDKPVTFEAVEKPSETAGFFSIGARETSDVNQSNAPHSPITILE